MNFMPLCPLYHQGNSFIALGLLISFEVIFKQVLDKKLHLCYVVTYAPISFINGVSCEDVNKKMHDLYIYNMKLKDSCGCLGYHPAETLYAGK